MNKRIPQEKEKTTNKQNCIKQDKQGEMSTKNLDDQELRNIMLPL